MALTGDRGGSSVIRCHEEDLILLDVPAEELTDVLFRACYVMDQVPHEPYGRQMTMQEAIEIGQSWVEGFCEAYAFPGRDMVFQFEEVSAQLCTWEMGDDAYLRQMIVRDETLSEIRNWNQVVAEDRGDQLAESMYGYWKISFSGTGITVNLQIHAVSGQILQAYLETDTYLAEMEALPFERILTEYAASFELPGREEPVWEDGGLLGKEGQGDVRFILERTPASEENGSSQDPLYGMTSFSMGAELVPLQETPDEEIPQPQQEP